MSRNVVVLLAPMMLLIASKNKFVDGFVIPSSRQWLQLSFDQTTTRIIDFGLPSSSTQFIPTTSTTIPRIKTSLYLTIKNKENDESGASKPSTSSSTPTSMLQSEVFYDDLDDDGVEDDSRYSDGASVNGQKGKKKEDKEASTNGSKQQQQQQQQQPSLVKQLVQNDDLRYSENRTIDQVGFSFLEDFAITMDDAMRLTPFIVPVVAYAFYDDIASSFAFLLDITAKRNFVSVDGGAYEAKIIAPAINGVVIPAISLLFANLIATTVTTLRQRQLDIRFAINMEASQLRILNSMIGNFPSPKARLQCWSYLAQYTSRLIAESQPTVNVDSLDSSFDSELNGLLNELNRISYNDVNYDDGDSAVTQKEIPGSVLGTCFSACTALFEERSKRITALRSIFPPLHFVIVANLAVSILIAFLLETDQVLLVFLNAVQLKILWTMLVGTFTALAIVCYDLSNPFRGSYQISKSVNQLYTIRLTLRASIDNIKKEIEKKNMK